MTQSMREKAVEAMAKAIVDSEPPLCWDTTWDGVCEAPTVRAQYITKATAAFDAAIKVLMEPDEAMLRAGAAMTDDEGDAGAGRAKGVLWAMLKTASEGK